MGEIGRDRREFLYEMRQWEIVLITRGYFRRYRPGWEQARLISYYVHYCMGVKKGQTAKTPTEFIPFKWEREAMQATLPTEAEVREMQELMRHINFETSKPAT